MLDIFEYCPPQQPLMILYQDKDLLVVNKPSGILTNPGRGEALADCLLSRVQLEFPSALLVHRLDLGTSGVVVFALRRNAERELKRQFAERLVKKRYLAVVAGFLSSDEGIITLPLRADPLNPPTQHVHPEGKAAETAYRVLQRSCKQGLEQSLVELKPVTGRSHQLRVHMAALGHPILGDNFYAPKPLRLAATRLLLHAAELSLLQPYQQQPLTFTADTDFILANGQILI
jgi:tRNA pseudouridine32 synthase / 23S rRNA pseudouridine746 synthase